MLTFLFWSYEKISVWAWIPSPWPSFCWAFFVAGGRVLLLRSSSWMKRTPWRHQLRLLSGGPWRKSPAPPASASSVTTSAGQLTCCTQLWAETVCEAESWPFCMCVLFLRIIEPLTSRCSKFRFKPLANQIQEERLLEICEKENLKYTKEVREGTCVQDSICTKFYTQRSQPSIYALCSATDHSSGLNVYNSTHTKQHAHTTASWGTFSFCASGCGGSVMTVCPPRA